MRCLRCGAGNEWIAKDKPMPAKISKVRGGYSVRTPNMVHAKKTTKTKAKKQQRLLNAIDHGFVPGRTKF